MPATVGERILVHLSGFERYANEIDGPEDVTQGGIARALGLSRAHVALEVNRLIAARRLTLRLLHVRGSRHRRKAYFPSAAGYARVAVLRDDVRRRRFTMMFPDGHRRDLGGPDASALLVGAGAREHQALLRLLDSDLVAVSGGSPGPAPPEPFVGRREERARLLAFAREGRGILVIHGPAGIGKTALAASVACSQPGPWIWHRARRGEAREELLLRIAHHLDERGRPVLLRCLSRGDLGTNSLEALRRDARGLLVVVDGADAAPDLVPLARAAGPSARFLLLSTEPLGHDLDSVALGPLSDAEGRSLVRARRPDLPDRTVSEIARVAAGNPGFLDLAVRLPADSEDPLGTHLAELEPREREALRYAAVFEAPFAPEALRGAYVPLRALTRRGLVHPVPGGYAVPGIVRDHVLRPLDRGTRLALHSRAAAYFAADGEHVDEAVHLLQADRAEEAAARLSEVLPRLAPERPHTAADLLRECLGSGANDERYRVAYLEACQAAGLFVTARRVAEGLQTSASPRHRLAALLGLGRSAIALNDAGGALPAFSEARKLAASMDDLAAEGRACQGLGDLQLLAGNPHGAVELFAKASRLLTAAHDRAEADAARLEQARALVAMDDVPAALALLRPLGLGTGGCATRASVLLARLEGRKPAELRALAASHGLFDLEEVAVTPGLDPGLPTTPDPLRDPVPMEGIPSIRVQ